MAEESESSRLVPYEQHVEKLGKFEARRVLPYDEEEVKKVEGPQDLIALLTGKMKLPDEIEGKMWMTIAGAVMEAQGQGIRMDGDEFSLLDLLLICATKTDEFPVLLLIEVMLASDEHVVVIRGRPVHAGQLYNITYSGWSEMEDLKERGRHHFKFGFLLLTIGEGARAAQQLYLATKCDASSGATELLKKLLTSENGTVVTSAGTRLTLQESGEVTAEEGVAPPMGSEAGDAALPTGGPTPLPPTPAAAPAAAAQPRKLMQNDDEESSGSMLPYLVAGAAALGVAIVAWRLMSKKQ